MLPEQVWDDDDLPNAGMSIGRPAGSAMPLMWAHAEYIKLLRSIVEGQVFDLIPVVADRYQKHRGRKDLEVWKPIRQIREMLPGRTLRVQAPAPFQLHWSLDGWGEKNDTRSVPTDLGIEYVDIDIPRDQCEPLKFTFFWPTEQRWEGRDYEIGIQTLASDAR